MKAIDFIKAHREACIDSLFVEIRADDWAYKCVVYKNKDVLDEEPVLQREIIDWFIDVVDSVPRFVINVEYNKE